MALEILSTLSSKRLSFPDSTTINTKNTVLPWQLAERSSQKVKQYYCFLTQCQGPSYHLYHTERERKAFWVNLPACQLQTPGTTPFPVPPPPVLFSLQVAIWAPKISKNSDTSSLRPLRERSILWLGLFRLFPASPLLHREALCCQAGCRGRDTEAVGSRAAPVETRPPLYPVNILTEEWNMRACGRIACLRPDTQDTHFLAPRGTGRAQGHVLFSQLGLFSGS